MVGFLNRSERGYQETGPLSAAKDYNETRVYEEVYGG